MSGYELLAELDRQLKDCLYISNECLPDGFRDERTDGVSLSTLERKCDERDKESEHMYTQRQKAARVKIYAEQIASGQEITYVQKCPPLPWQW